MSGKIGSLLRTAKSQAQVRLLKELGAGGQATVYLAHLAGQDVAVKLFFSDWHNDELKRQIEFAITCGSPGPSFCWPFEAIAEPGELGVVMPIIRPGCVSIEDLLLDRVRPSMMTLAKVCYELAEAFLQLHAKGLCYKDINRNNVHFHPQTGDVFIVDNENVAYNLTAKSPNIGTVGYMAPELGRGESPCTINTDLYSLGVLLFEILCVSHPLSGKREQSIVCLTAEELHRLYCLDPVFIFDPADSSNRPDLVEHANALTYWRIYPTFLRDLFTRHFTAGLARPQDERVREVEWRRAFLRLADSILPCDACGVENFFDEQTAQAACWHCAKSLSQPRLLHFREGHDVVLSSKTTLYPHHCQKRAFDLSKPVAQVVVGPGDWGLQNLTANPWTVKRPDGSIVTAPPGATVRLSVATQIKFPGNNCVVR